MRKKTVGIIGLMLFVFALFLIVADNFGIEFLNKLSEYGKYFAILGGGLIGVGFFGKKKEKSK